jgi:hypothetical protein
VDRYLLGRNDIHAGRYWWDINTPILEDAVQSTVLLVQKYKQIIIQEPVYKRKTHHQETITPT